MEYTTNYVKAGAITTKETRKGLELFSNSFERRKPVSIGTLSGKVYEKVSSIYRKENTFNLLPAELTQIKDAGGEFIRIVMPDKSATFTISVQDFERHAKEIFMPPYGKQLACSLSKFQYVGAVVKRNPITDNPPAMRNDPYEPVTSRQISLF
jgi:hypothetical protein